MIFVFLLVAFLEATFAGSDFEFLFDEKRHFIAIPAATLEHPLSHPVLDAYFGHFDPKLSDKQKFLYPLSLLLIQRDIAVGSSDTTLLDSRSYEFVVNANGPNRNTAEFIHQIVTVDGKVNVAIGRVRSKCSSQSLCFQPDPVLADQLDQAIKSNYFAIKTPADNRFVAGVFSRKLQDTEEIFVIESNLFDWGVQQDRVFYWNSQTAQLEELVAVPSSSRSPSWAHAPIAGNQLWDVGESRFLLYTIGQNLLSFQFSQNRKHPMILSDNNNDNHVFRQISQNELVIRTLERIGYNLSRIRFKNSRVDPCILLKFNR